MDLSRCNYSIYCTSSSRVLADKWFDRLYCAHYCTGADFSSDANTLHAAFILSLQGDGEEMARRCSDVVYCFMHYFRLKPAPAQFFFMVSIRVPDDMTRQSSNNRC